MADAVPTPGSPSHSLAARAARRLGELGHRVLHTRRRRAAQALLRARRPSRLLVLCLGNICRSPFAEHALRGALRERQASHVAVRSAGFIHPGRPSPPLAVEAAQALGVLLAEHRSIIIDASVLEWADLLLVMDPAHEARLRALELTRLPPVVYLADFDPVGWQPRLIADPFDKPRAEFDRCYVRIKRCVVSLAESLAGPVEVSSRDA